MNIQYLKLADRSINYKLVKSKRAKHARLQIGISKGLEVILPFKAVRKINPEELIKSKRAWILKHLDNLERLNEKFFYLGREIFIKEEVSIGSTEKNKNTAIGENYTVDFNNDTLCITYSMNNSYDKKNIYNQWIFEIAKNYLTDRVRQLADRYGFVYKDVKVKDHISRWGSCSSKNALSFNSKLMYFNNQAIDYVIIHELCHLREMNHSKKFWSLVESLMPDYRVYKKQLKSYFPTI